MLNMDEENWDKLSFYGDGNSSTIYVYKKDRNIHIRHIKRCKNIKNSWVVIVHGVAGSVKSDLGSAIDSAIGSIKERKKKYRKLEKAYDSLIDIRDNGGQKC